jgi:hypothetical protein
VTPEMYNDSLFAGITDHRPMPGPLVVQKEGAEKIDFYNLTVG